jgi:hypothetical protein
MIFDALLILGFGILWLILAAYAFFQIAVVLSIFDLALRWLWELGRDVAGGRLVSTLTRRWREPAPAPQVKGAPPGWRSPLVDKAMDENGKLIDRAQMLDSVEHDAAVAKFIRGLSDGSIADHPAGKFSSKEEYEAYVRALFGWQEGDEVVARGRVVYDASGDPVDIVPTEEVIFRGGVCVRVKRFAGSEDKQQEGYCEEPHETHVSSQRTDIQHKPSHGS